jgi:hypothetical protein
MILAVDPGKHAAGMAWFDGERLIAAEYISTPSWSSQIKTFCLNELHLERQYLPKKHPRPMDIVDLAHAAGIVRGMVEFNNPWVKVFEYQPVQWKGNVPKQIMIRRIQACLSGDELSRVLKIGAKDHNTYDAIGIGLFALGRLK